MAFGTSAQNLTRALVAALFLVLTLGASATSCPGTSTTTCFVNLDGFATTHGTGASTTFSLSNSELTQIGNMTGSNLGTIAFTTGTLASGTLMNGGTFNAGGSFTISGTYGNISNGILFQGQFSGPVTWSLNSPSNCTVCTYTLSGTISGNWFVHGTQFTNGATVQINFTSNGLYKGGKITDVGGVSYVDVAAIPESTTISLMGTGLIGIGLIVRRKASREP